jgi:hypothetical protein
MKKNMNKRINAAANKTIDAILIFNFLDFPSYCVLL